MLLYLSSTIYLRPCISKQLSIDQIIATFQCDRLQHYWVQHALRIYLATLSEIVGSNLTILKLDPATPNIFNRGQNAINVLRSTMLRSFGWDLYIPSFPLHQPSFNQDKSFFCHCYILAFSNTKKQNLLRVLQPRLLRN